MLSHRIDLEMMELAMERLRAVQGSDSYLGYNSVHHEATVNSCGL